MVLEKFNITQEQIRNFCRNHHIKKISVFGSYIHEDYTSESDVDILVEFEKECIPGLRFALIEEELSHLLERPVDLHTVNSLSRYFRDHVIAEAEVQYAKE